MTGSGGRREPHFGRRISGAGRAADAEPGAGHWGTQGQAQRTDLRGLGAVITQVVLKVAEWMAGAVAANVERGARLSPSKAT